MKKILLWFFFALFLILGFLGLPGGGALTELSTESFRYFMRWEHAREVFDLDEEEAAAVFGESGEASYL